MTFASVHDQFLYYCNRKSTTATRSKKKKPNYTDKQTECVCAYAVNEMKKKPEDLNAIRITVPRVLHTVENVSEVKKMRERHTQQEEKK